MCSRSARARLGVSSSAVDRASSLSSWRRISSAVTGLNSTRSAPALTGRRRERDRQVAADDRDRRVPLLDLRHQVEAEALPQPHVDDREIEVVLGNVSLGGSHAAC